ncbi:fragile histidine triad protein [Spinellus fusiger]|nr:fragile histidine triad protein [Spinellus fusiger]
MTDVKFGHYTIKAHEVFYETQLTVGLVNLKPIALGHVLVVPRRHVQRYSELEKEELLDLTCSARLIAATIEREYQESVCWVIQDGEDAGQTVPHVHLHIIPKRFSQWRCGIEKERKPRTVEEMTKERDFLSQAMNCAC